MRVPPQPERARRNLNERQEAHARAGRAQAPRSGPAARRGQERGRGGQGAGHQRAHLQPLAESVRGPEGGRGQGAASTEGRERAAEADGRRPLARQPDVEGGGAGKLLSPARRRDAVRHLGERFQVSERRACRAIGQSRTTQRRPPRPVLAPEQQLRWRLREISRDWPRFGYRFAHTLLRREGWKVNRKRLQRLWREEGLRVRL